MIVFQQETELLKRLDPGLDQLGLEVVAFDAGLASLNMGSAAGACSATAWRQWRHFCPAITGPCVAIAVAEPGSFDAAEALGLIMHEFAHAAPDLDQCAEEREDIGLERAGVEELYRLAGSPPLYGKGGEKGLYREKAFPWDGHGLRYQRILLHILDRYHALDWPLGRYVDHWLYRPWLYGMPPVDWLYSQLQTELDDLRGIPLYEVAKAEPPKSFQTYEAEVMAEALKSLETKEDARWVKYY